MYKVTKGATSVAIISESGIGDFLAKSYAFQSIEDKFGKNIKWIFYIKDLDNESENRTNIINDFVNFYDWDADVKFYYDSVPPNEIVKIASDEYDFVYSPWVKDEILSPSWIRPSMYWRFSRFNNQKTIPDSNCICHMYSGSRKNSNRNISSKDRIRSIEILNDIFQGSICIYCWDDPSMDEYSNIVSKDRVIYNYEAQDVLYHAFRCENKLFFGVNSWVSIPYIYSNSGFIWSENGYMKNLAQHYYQNIHNVPHPIKLVSSHKYIPYEISEFLGHPELIKNEKSYDSSYFNEEYFTQCINSTYGEWNIPTRELYVQMRDYMLDCIPIDKNSNILEIGSGNGGLMLRFHEMGYEIDGIDISEWAKENSPEEIKNNIYTLDINKDWNINKKYKFIYSNQTIEHIERDNISNILNTICDILEEDGILYIQTPILGWGHNDNVSKIDTSHRTFFTYEEWNKLAKDSGFYIDKDISGKLLNHTLYNKLKCDGIILKKLT